MPTGESHKNVFVMAAVFALAVILFSYAPAKAEVFTRNLKVGSRGGDVSVLQQTLKDENVYPSGLVTGYFGAATKAAVKKFQAKYDLPQVGKVGPATRAKLNELAAEPISFREIQNQLRSIIQYLNTLMASRPILQEQVTAIQQRIRDLKYKIFVLLDKTPASAAATSSAASIAPTGPMQPSTGPTAASTAPRTITSVFSDTTASTSSSTIAAAQKTLNTLDTIQKQLSGITADQSNDAAKQMQAQVDQLTILQNQISPSITVTPSGTIQLTTPGSGSTSSLSALLSLSSSTDAQNLQSQIDAMQKLMQQMNSQLLNPGSAMPSPPQIPLQP